MGPVDLINTIIDLAEVQPAALRDGGPHLIFVTATGLIIGFSGQKKDAFLKAVTEAYSADSEIERTYTRAYYIQLLLDEFEAFIKKRKVVGADDINKFLRRLKATAVQKFSVFRDIYGIRLTNPERPLSLGGFSVYSFATQQAAIESRVAKNRTAIWFDRTPEYLIEWNAEARHHEKATEIADRKFKQFELILRFMIGTQTERSEVGILDYREAPMQYAYTFSGTGEMSGLGQRAGPIMPIPLDDPYFLNEEYGHRYAWELASQDNLHEMQKRVLLAMEWIGQSIDERSEASAFLKSAIAIEILLANNDRGIITPSILSQISEGAALILGASTEDRMKIERQIRSLYSLRSKIVHSGQQ